MATLNTAQLLFFFNIRIGQSSATSSLDESSNILNVINSLIVPTTLTAYDLHQQKN